MRHHDIERLKLAAGRIAMGIELLTDIEDVCEYAVDKLDEPSGVHKVDNGDGTETWYGLPVVVPVGLAPDDETPVEVRSMFRGIEGPTINCAGVVRRQGVSGNDNYRGDLRIVLADKPEPITWTPPASLADGTYEWNGSHFSKSGEAFCISKSGGIPIMFADWTDPPRAGRYRKTGNVATWIGE